ncbi:MAG: HEPN domain-containing protein [Candidatus Heimdallarchaeota archaeon]|nr:HEPN domain-containing protein [Candidatus Heimdallarchaeota archaeon]
MRIFKEKLTKLLSECEEIMHPEKSYEEALIIENKKSQSTKRYYDEKKTISSSLFSNIDKIISLESYKITEQYFKNDDVFSDATNMAGANGTFYHILSVAIKNSSCVRENKIVIDYNKSIALFDKYRKIFSKNKLKFKVTCRLLGVQLTMKEVEIEKDFILRRLNKNEINKKTIGSSIIKSNMTYSERWNAHGFLDHNTELEVFLTLPVDKNKKNNFLTLYDDAYKLASEIFHNFENAIILSKSGDAKVACIVVEGEMEGFVHRLEAIPSVRNNSIRINKSEIDRIKSAYRIVINKSSKDKVLSGAVRRFLIGRKRADHSDKLIDYVIAWEGILLTNAGNAINQELSYRFSLNSSLLIPKVDKSNNNESIFSTMKNIYSVRSSIVHGSDNSKIDLLIKKTGFPDTSALCVFLEEKFRKVIFWLNSIKTEERPYKKNGGWEKLIWEK